MLIVTADGTITGFGLSNPKLFGKRDAVLQILAAQPANLPHKGTIIVCDKGFAGRNFQAAMAARGMTITRPARKDEPEHHTFPNWLRQRMEPIIWTLKSQLGLEDHGARIAAGLWTRVVQRLLALNVAIWHNWTIGAHIKRSLIAYDH